MSKILTNSLADALRRASLPLPEVIASLGGLALLIALALLPGPFSGAHAFAILGVALSFAALVAMLPGRREHTRTQETSQLVRLGAIADQLERRTENLQDVQWQASERESRYRQLLDAQSDLILRVDHKRKLTFANKAFCEMFEVSQSDVLGQPFSPDVIDGKGEKAGASPWFFDDQGPSEPLVQLISTPKGERWISWQVNELGVDQSGLFEFELVGRDVTLERQHRLEIDEARELAESANVAKSRFLAAMSHEIRTPMNGIMGMAALLRDTSLSDEQSTYVNAINQSANTLLSLIDEILDFSKIEAGRLSLSSEPFAIADSVRDAVELLAPRAHSKGLELAWFIAPDVPDRVIGDTIRVRQVLLNLLSNAIKFTNSGGVVVSAELGCKFEQDGNDHYQVLFHVKDTGVGLSEDAQEKLFREFERSVADGNVQPEGTGLGLAISRRLARAMAGDISIVSTPNDGSTFTVELVLEGDPDAADGNQQVQRSGEPVDATPPARVLLAIDQKIEREVLAHILACHGHVAVEVGFNDAAEAIRAAGRNGEVFDAVVANCGVSPTAAGRLIAASEELGKRPHGLVIAEVSERARISLFRETGFDAFAIRPVRPHVFLERIGIGEKAENSGMPVDGDPGVSSAPATAEPEPEGVPASARAVEQPVIAAADGEDGQRRLVLVVEDNEINILLATKVLERAGLDVLTATTGSEAVKHMRLALQGAARMPDAILMDIYLPDMDGVETSRQIKQLFQSQPEDPRSAADCPPIVALTAHAFAEDRRRYLAEGMDECLTKPFNPADLTQVLMRLFAERQKRSNPAA